VSYYKTYFSVLRKSPKYAVYASHFSNLPFNVEFSTEKETEEVGIFYLKCDNINDLNDALEWIEETIGMEPYKTEWFE
jgi:hypothetical protein